MVNASLEAALVAATDDDFQIVADVESEMAPLSSPTVSDNGTAAAAVNMTLTELAV